MNNLLWLLETWLPIAKDVVLTGASLIAGYVDLMGLGTRHRQLKGNTEYKLAKKLLKSAYELREAIETVRHPFLQYSQEPDMPEEKLKELSEREKQWHAMAQAYQRRWGPVSKAKSVLDTALLEAEVVWGQEIVRKVKPLNGLNGELLWAIQDHLEAMNPNINYESPGAKEIKKRRQIMYAIGDTNKDEFWRWLEGVIGSIENEIKPHIE